MNYVKLLLFSTIFTYHWLHAAQAQEAQVTRRQCNIARALMQREHGQSTQAQQFFSEYILPEALKCCSQFNLLVNEELPAAVGQSLAWAAAQAYVHYQLKYLEDAGHIWGIEYQCNSENIKPLIPVHVRACINQLYLEQMAAGQKVLANLHNLNEIPAQHIPARTLTKREQELLKVLPIFVKYALFKNLNLKPYVHPCRKMKNALETECEGMATFSMQAVIGVGISALAFYCFILLTKSLPFA